MQEPFEIHRDLNQLHKKIFDRTNSSQAAEGVCVLYTEMAINAFLMGVYHTEFSQLMRYIYKHRNDESRLLASPKVQDFFKKGDLYQSTFVYTSLLTHLSPSPDLAQITAHLDLPRMTEQGGRVIVGKFAGCYSTDELIDYLKLLFTFTLDIKRNFCISLSSGDHRNGYCFDAQENEWHFIEANAPLFSPLPPVLNRDYLRNLAMILMDVFREVDYTCFETIMTTTGKQLAQVEKEYGKFSNHKGFKALVKPDSSKAVRMTANGYDLLYHAVESGDLSLVEKIIAMNRPYNFNHRYPQGQNLAYVASKFNQLPILSLLAEIKNPDGSYAVDLNMPSGGGYTPLYIATLRGYTKIVEYLIGLRQADGQPRIDVDCLTDSMQSGLMASIIKGYPEILKLFIKAPRPQGKIRDLLNAKLHKDYTAVFIAVYSGREDILSVLIDAKDENGLPLVELDHPIDDGSTVLFLAVQQGYSQIVKTLLAARMPDGQPRVDLHHRSLGYDSPLHLAVGIGNREIVDLLIDAGASLHQRWKDYLPWEIALNSGHQALAKYLKYKTEARLEILPTGAYGFFQRISSSLGRSTALLTAGSFLGITSDSGMTEIDGYQGEVDAPSNAALIIGIGMSGFVLALLIYCISKLLQDNSVQDQNTLK